MTVTTRFVTPEAKIAKLLGDLQQHPAIMRKAIAFALDDTAEGLRQAEVMEMEVVFNNPRKYTLNAIYTVKARGDNSLKAGVAWREFGGSIPAYKYLTPQIFGGPRGDKRHEVSLRGKGILPAGSQTAQGRNYPKDGTGDITGGQYTRMLAELGALEGTPRGAKSRPRKNGDAFFVLHGKDTKYPIGIAERKGGNVTVMLRFIKAPTYQKRFDYYGVADEYVRVNFPRNLTRQFNKWMPLQGYSGGGLQFAA